eukprot:997396-Rhodomonas_salina.1
MRSTLPKSLHSTTSQPALRSSAVCIARHSSQHSTAQLSASHCMVARQLSFLHSTTQPPDSLAICIARHSSIAQHSCLHCSASCTAAPCCPWCRGQQSSGALPPAAPPATPLRSPSPLPAPPALHPTL